jgi:orotate phosphoribosyltransferase
MSLTDGHHNRTYGCLAVAAPRLRPEVVDDTMTTGARVHSAASALQPAGAHVVAAVVVGRVITPDFNEESRRLWDAAGDQRFEARASPTA